MPCKINWRVSPSYERGSSLLCALTMFLPLEMTARALADRLCLTFEYDLILGRPEMGMG